MLENKVLQDIIIVIYNNKEWLLGVLLFLGLLFLFICLVRMKNSTDPIMELIEATSVESLNNIVLLDDMDGEIHIEYLLLTARGLVILDIKTSGGTVFGGNQMNEWTILTGHERVSIQNPQEALHNRLMALRLLVRDIPVLGHVLFIQGADFSQGRPDDVILPEEFIKLYEKPAKAELERITEAFSPCWRAVCCSARPAL